MSECIQSGRLSDYLDGHLTPEERDELEAHLENASNCRCRDELVELRSLVAELRGLSPGLPPPSGWAKLEVALDHKRAHGGSGLRRWVTLAAGLVVGLFLLGWIASQQGDDEALPAGATTPAGAVSSSMTAGRLHHPDIQPQVALAMRQVRLPEVVFRDDRLADTGAELKSLDALIELARGLPVGDGDQDFQDYLRRLQLLREDLLTEMILQAQADRTATWQ